MQRYPMNTGLGHSDSISANALPVGIVELTGRASLWLDRDPSEDVGIADGGAASRARDGASIASGLDRARAAQIRARILSGAYASLAVVDAIARRLLDSGDL